MNYWIWFSTIKDLGARRKKLLLDIYKTPEAIYNAKNSELEKVYGIGVNTIKNIENSRNVALINDYEAYIQKNNIKILNIFDEKYPERLKNIYDPPVTLYVRGNVDILNEFCIAVVGCRDATRNGILIANDFGEKLSKSGVVVVSGLAKGIDAAAQRGALNGVGKTIAVLGTGVDIVYPSENVGLYKDIIINGGAIVSEYIVGTKPNPLNFPVRNRIVSGLSNGVLIVEAKLRSGTMITTDLALEQGRNVYVIPGNIYSKQSEGTNELIKQGAKIVTNTEDILEDFI